MTSTADRAQKIRFEGALVAIATPMRDDETVDHDDLRRLIELLIENGIDGIVPCGTTGEAATLTKDECVRVIETTVDQVAGRVPVIAGSGTNSTAATVDFSKVVAGLGVDGLLVVAPYYNKPTQEGLYRHFRAVADAVDLPQVVYNVPGRTACRIEVDTLTRLADHPNIVATKDATGDLYFGSATLEACGEQLVVLSGNDDTAFPLLAVGGGGVISVVGNVAPRVVSDMCLACREARWTDARQLHYQILPLFRAMFSTANPIPVKAALSLMGYGANRLRLPLVPLEREALDMLRLTLERAAILDGGAR